MSLFCLTCGHITSHSEYLFQIEECWCGGHLITNYLWKKIISKEKSLRCNLHLFNLDNKLDRTQEQDMINYAIAKQLLREEAFLRIYLTCEKHIKENPLIFLIKIIDYVLSD